MDKNLVAKKYSEALFAIYKEKKSHKAFDESLKKISRFVQDNHEVVTILNSPVIPKVQRVATAEKIVEKLKLDSEVAQFFVILVQNRKIELLENILNNFQNLVNKSKNIIKIIISFADKVSKDLVSKLTKLVETETKMKVDCETVIDPSLVGGFTLQYQSIMLDNSVKNQLNTLKKLAEEKFQYYELNSSEKY